MARNLISDSIDRHIGTGCEHCVGNVAAEDGQQTWQDREALMPIP
jgi:hypothetical protein